MYKSFGMSIAAVTLLACLIGSPLVAQDLEDPMRPTTSRLAPVEEAEPEQPSRPATPQRFLPADHSLDDIYMLGPIQRARINGTWYVPGDHLINGTIIDIMPHAVVVEADDLFHVLYLDRERALFNFSQEAQ